MATTLGDRIQQLRKTAGLTQAQLADKIKISSTQLVRYEIRGVQPPAHVLQKLASVLDTSVDFLINGDKDQKVKAALKDDELFIKFKKIEQLPADKQKLVKELLDLFIFRDSVKQLTH